MTESLPATIHAHEHHQCNSQLRQGCRIDEFVAGKDIDASRCTQTGTACGALAGICTPAFFSSSKARYLTYHSSCLSTDAISCSTKSCQTERARHQTRHQARITPRRDSICTPKCAFSQITMCGCRSLLSPTLAISPPSPSRAQAAGVLISYLGSLDTVDMRLPSILRAVPQKPFVVAIAPATRAAALFLENAIDRHHFRGQQRLLMFPAVHAISQGRKQSH
jgi:hypothetical protein